jgi:hypothetical protein
MMTALLRRQNLTMTTLFQGRAYWLQRWVALLLTGVMAGLSGMLLAMLLHEIQHLAYGYSQNVLISPQTFLEGVSDASAQRRFIVLVAAGIVAGEDGGCLPVMAKSVSASVRR